VKPWQDQAIVSQTSDGRAVYGRPGTRFAHCAGRIISRTTRVWGGGETTMPYWADGDQSPYLTDDEICAHCLLPDGEEAAA